MIGRGNRSTRRKPVPLPLCAPQTPHAAHRRTRAAAVGSQRLTAWATARPWQYYNLSNSFQFDTSLITPWYGYCFQCGQSYTIQLSLQSLLQIHFAPVSTFDLWWEVWGHILHAKVSTKTLEPLPRRAQSPPARRSTITSPSVLYTFTELPCNNGTGQGYPNKIDTFPKYNEIWDSCMLRHRLFTAYYVVTIMGPL
jgi:hypothetical protein